MASRRYELTSFSFSAWVLGLFFSCCQQRSCTNVSAHKIGEEGSPLCPCLSEDAVARMNNQALPLGLRDDNSNNKQILHLRRYGTGCHLHDAKSPLCLEDSPCVQNQNMVPKPLGCDNSWCQRRWCFVDPRNCSLAHRRSESSSYGFFSYATCGDIDSFTHQQRFASLEGQEFKMGLNANSGGWLGAYADDDVHFKGPIDNWSGLAIDYVTSAAFKGKFQFKITEPPEFLWNQSVAYFQSESKFDFCVYAASLGYLDLCVAQYTVTDQRAASTDWLLLGSSGLYLVAITGKRTDNFLNSVFTIFMPFTTQTWFFVVLIFIPILGCLMVVHERGRGGASAYPTEEMVLVTDDETGVSEVKRIRIPLYRSCSKSVYVSLLAVLQQSYDPSVSTLGAMLNLLGIAFFILTIVAVYTANLAAMLTTSGQSTSVSDLSDAIEAGYRFCCERKNMESVLRIHRDLDSSMFAVDPIELGGDGLPGFGCTGCASRLRVFDFMDPALAAWDSSYCHAAIAPEEDLDVLLARGIHCNKTVVGKPIQMVQTGMPIFEHVSPQLISFFLKLMNDGEYDSALLNNRPQSKCATADTNPEEGALTMVQLSGIWVVSAAFALVGLVVTFCQHCYKRNAKSKTHTKRIYKRDQRGGRIDALGLQDAWLAGGVVNDRPELVNELADARNMQMDAIRESYGAAQLLEASHLMQGLSDSSRGNGEFRRRSTATRVKDRDGQTMGTASEPEIDLAVIAEVSTSEDVNSSNSCSNPSFVLE